MPTVPRIENQPASSEARPDPNQTITPVETGRRYWQDYYESLQMGDRILEVVQASLPLFGGPNYVKQLATISVIGG
jgi:hypothetical protein